MKTFCRVIGIIIFVSFCMFVSYGLYKQYKNGFVSPYYFGDK